MKTTGLTMGIWTAVAAAAAVAYGQDMPQLGISPQDRAGIEARLGQETAARTVVAKEVYYFSRTGSVRGNAGMTLFGGDRENYSFSASYELDGAALGNTIDEAKSLSYKFVEGPEAKAENDKSIQRLLEDIVFGVTRKFTIEQKERYRVSGGKEGSPYPLVDIWNHEHDITPPSDAERQATMKVLLRMAITNTLNRYGIRLRNFKFNED
ncbi:MAG: hypothetical protein NTX64_09425 [Elusimicrobia bacterium]|nr:hypothetical protein [Elusimicrobiota bacterium]